MLLYSMSQKESMRRLTISNSYYCNCYYSLWLSAEDELYLYIELYTVFR